MLLLPALLIIKFICLIPIKVWAVELPIDSINQINTENIIEKANNLYDNKKTEEAKELYTMAAASGNPKAHFALAYNYNLTKKDKIYHLSEAAKQGHEQALSYILDIIFFRANSLEFANPQTALSLYEQAKEANPSLTLEYGENEKIKTIQMAVEAGEFDYKKFINQYDISISDKDELYSVWKIAEKISKDREFGAPDPKLILQIVARGGEVPAELESAISKFYENWKKGVVQEFNICDHITSGIGGNLCSAREEANSEKKISRRLQDFSPKLNKKQQFLLNKAYSAASNFIDLKTTDEEGHGGTARLSSITYSKIKQLEDYITLIEKVYNGFKPTPKHTQTEADQKLNFRYKERIEIINTRRESDDYQGYLPSVEDIRKVQRSWILFRDASIRLFLSINSSITAEEWNSWLTEIREQQLTEVPFN